MYGWIVGIWAGYMGAIYLGKGFVWDIGYEIWNSGILLRFHVFLYTSMSFYSTSVEIPLFLFFLQLLLFSICEIILFIILFLFFCPLYRLIAL